MRSALRLSMVALIASAGLASANMLTNPGFEIEGASASDPADWSLTNPFVVVRAAANPSGTPEHGDWTLHLQELDANFHWANQVVAVTPGNEYTATADFKAYLLGSGELAYILMEWFDAGGGAISSTFSTYENSHDDYADWVWVSRSVTGIAPTNAAQVSVRVMSKFDGDTSGGGSRIIADNVVLTIPPPNLLANPDFETEGPGGPEDPDGWDRSDTLYVKRYEDVGQPDHGDWMVNFDDGPASSLWASQTFPATPGEEFFASAQFKAAFQPGESTSVDLVWLDSGGAEIGSNSSTYAQSDGDYAIWAWATRSVTAMAPIGTAEVRMQMTSHLAGGSDSALWGDNAELRFLRAVPMVPATILSWTAISNGVMQMVIDAPGITSAYHPEATTDLAGGVWTNVPHSATAGGTYSETNLSYSTTDATGTNEVIYIQTTEAAKFFNIVGPE